MSITWWIALYVTVGIGFVIAGLNGQTFTTIARQMGLWQTILRAVVFLLLWPIPALALLGEAAETASLWIMDRLP